MANSDKSIYQQGENKKQTCFSGDKSSNIIYIAKVEARSGGDKPAQLMHPLNIALSPEVPAQYNRRDCQQHINLEAIKGIT
jgi:hypothetical protein